MAALYFGFRVKITGSCRRKKLPVDRRDSMKLVLCHPNIDKQFIGLRAGYRCCDSGHSGVGNSVEAYTGALAIALSAVAEGDEIF